MDDTPDAPQHTGAPGDMPGTWLPHGLNHRARPVADQAGAHPNTHAAGGHHGQTQ